MNTRPKVNQLNVPGAGLSPGLCDVSGHLRPVVASCAGAAMTGAPGWRREAGPGTGGGPQRGAAILNRAMRVRWPEGSGACDMSRDALRPATRNWGYLRIMAVGGGGRLARRRYTLIQRPGRPYLPGHPGQGDDESPPVPRGRPQVDDRKD